jgi:hypothetical protein
MQQSDGADQAAGLTVSHELLTSKHESSSLAGTAGLLLPAVKQQSPRLDRSRLTLLLRNANSHADRHGHGCPSAPAKQHSRGAHLTAALQR